MYRSEAGKRGKDRSFGVDRSTGVKFHQQWAVGIQTRTSRAETDNDNSAPVHTGCPNNTINNEYENPQNVEPDESDSERRTENGYQFD